ncbi:MAG: glycosyltransferase [Dysgonamonadaceae bacterium]|jgi:glycosyltransferase involved in cell wall biosynthesis|nr:glycosyltransferase [Dysgonamonadaceae bacterium]
MVSLIEIILLSILAVSFITQMIFYWVVLGKPYYYMRAVNKGRIRFSSDTPPVSVIIYVRNRFHDLQDFLPALLEQDYPQFEVIIINDGMTEDNSNILIRLQELYSNLYSTHIPVETRNVSRRKLGLTLGIKAAKYDCLLFTEADSHTRSKDWIRLMSRHFTSKNVVLGMSAKENEEGFFTKFMIFDYFFTNLQILSMALFNHPHAGSGRNLIYSKTHFNEQKGLVRHRSLRQIDDDLFINDIAAKPNTKVELSSESVIMTDLNVYDWIQEKKDKAFIKQFYRIGPVAIWSLESFSRVIFLFSVIACLVWWFLNPNPLTLPYLCGASVACYMIKFFSQLFIINRTASLLHLKKFYLAVPLYNLMQVLVNVYFSMYRIVHKKENYIFKYEKR